MWHDMGWHGWGFHTFAAALLALAFAVACDKPEAPEATPSAATASQTTLPDSKTRGDGHAMNMRAGETLHGNFKHKELVVLDPVEVPDGFEAKLRKITEQYYTMSKAFASDDPTAADAAASEMRQMMEQMKTPGLDAEAQDAWAGHRRAMRTALHQLTEAETLPEKREHLSHISEAMYCALKSFGDVEEGVFVAFCPMAMGGHGAYWLSDVPQIHNPYMGAEMPGCGEVKETIRRGAK